MFGRETTRDENLAALPDELHGQRRRTYNDRTINTFDGGFVIQYTLHGVQHSGHKGALWICIVGLCATARSRASTSTWTRRSSRRGRARHATAEDDVRKDWETLELCDRFFDAIEQKDYETLETCYAPEAVVWHSHDCLYQPRAANLAMLKHGMETQPKMRFKDRRVHIFEGGFVQQHTIYVTHAERLRRADGRVLRRLRARRHDLARLRVLRHGPDREVPRTSAAARRSRCATTSMSASSSATSRSACRSTAMHSASSSCSTSTCPRGLTCGSSRWVSASSNSSRTKSTPDAANPPGGSAGGTGLRYWTIGVDDIDAAVAKCEAAGAPIPLPSRS